VKPTDLAEVLKTLKEFGLLDRLGYISNEEIKLFAPADSVGTREPYDEHKAAEAREQRQTAWEKGVRAGHVARWTEPPQANGTADVPAEVKQDIRKERQRIRTEGA
jgi:hypothetical protein